MEKIFHLTIAMFISSHQPGPRCFIESAVAKRSEVPCIFSLLSDSGWSSSSSLVCHANRFYQDLDLSQVKILSSFFLALTICLGFLQLQLAWLIEASFCPFNFLVIGKILVIFSMIFVTNFIYLLTNSEIGLD